MNQQSDWQHCDTCVCGDHSHLRTLNARFEKLAWLGMSVGSRLLLPNSWLQRVSDSPKYQFGFREFLPSQGNMLLAGLFLLALNEKPKPEMQEKPLSLLANPWQRAEYEISLRKWHESMRFFGVFFSMPGHELRPFEYRRGDDFDLYGKGLPRMEDLPRLAEMSDSLLLALIDLHRAALRDFALSAFGELPPLIVRQGASTRLSEQPEGYNAKDGQSQSARTEGPEEAGERLRF